MTAVSTTNSQDIAVSVIVPVYNAERRLDATIRMLRKQTLTDCEFIFVDDGSTDGSSEVIARHSLDDGRVRYLLQAHSGAGAARNLGMTASRGSCIIFLDADDVYSPELLEKLFCALERDQSEVALCEMDSVDVRTGDVEPLVRFPKAFAAGGHDAAEFGPYLFRVCTNHPGNKMYRKALVQRQGLHYQTLANTNDLFFVCASCASASRFSLVEESLLTYRINQGGSIQDKYLDNPFCTFIACYVLHGWLKEHGLLDRGMTRSFKNLVMGNAFSSLRKVSVDAPLFREVCLQFAHAMRDLWGFEDGDDSALSRKQHYIYRCMMTSSVEPYRLALLPTARERFLSARTKALTAARMGSAAVVSKLDRSAPIMLACANTAVDVDAVAGNSTVEERCEALNTALNVEFIARFQKNVRGGVVREIDCGHLIGFAAFAPHQLGRAA